MKLLTGWQGPRARMLMSWFPDPYKEDTQTRWVIIDLFLYTLHLWPKLTRKAESSSNDHIKASRCSIALLLLWNVDWQCQTPWCHYMAKKKTPKRNNKYCRVHVCCCWSWCRGQCKTPVPTAGRVPMADIDTTVLSGGGRKALTPQRWRGRLLWVLETQNGNFQNSPHIPVYDVEVYLPGGATKLRPRNLRFLATPREVQRHFVGFQRPNFKVPTYPRVGWGGTHTDSCIMPGTMTLVTEHRAVDGDFDDRGLLYVSTELQQGSYDVSFGGSTWHIRDTWLCSTLLCVASITRRLLSVTLHSIKVFLVQLIPQLAFFCFDVVHDGDELVRSGPPLQHSLVHTWRVVLWPGRDVFTVGIAAEFKEMCQSVC